MSLSVSSVKSTNYQPSFKSIFKVELEQPGLAKKAAVSLQDFLDTNIRRAFGDVIPSDLMDRFVLSALEYEKAEGVGQEASSVLVFQPRGIITKSGLSMRHESSNPKLNKIRVGTEQEDLLSIIREGNLFEHLREMYYQLGATILDRTLEISLGARKTVGKS